MTFDNRVRLANKSLIYDVLVSYSLGWPSLTVDWVPGDVGTNECDDQGREIRHLICATQTSAAADESLIVAEVIKPNKSFVIAYVYFLMGI